MMKYFQVVLLGVMLLARIAAAEQPVSQTVVTVDGEAVSVDEYVYVVRKAIRERFYHGAVPEAELKTYRRELLDDLIDSYLLSAEARRRGLQAVGVESELAVQDTESLTSQLAVAERQRKDLIARLKQQVMADLVLSKAQVRGYYESNLDKFVRPEQNDVSVIVLGVDPSSSSAVWEDARLKAAALKAEVEGGGSFEELAEIHSSDISAAAGGAMGLLHRGLLGGEAEAVLKELAVGEISDPQMMLDGAVLFRLNSRIMAQQLPLDQVEVRARGLLQREQGELAWEALLFRLRGQANIFLNEPLLQKIGV